jgi:hypothetical protein
MGVFGPCRVPYSGAPILPVRPRPSGRRTAAWISSAWAPRPRNAGLCEVRRRLSRHREVFPRLCAMVRPCLMHAFRTSDPAEREFAAGRVSADAPCRSAADRRVRARRCVRPGGRTARVRGVGSGGVRTAPCRRVRLARPTPRRSLSADAERRSLSAERGSLTARRPSAPRRRRSGRTQASLLRFAGLLGSFSGLFGPQTRL